MVSILANAGTPLMWAGMCHLTVGNALIGCLEGWLISRWISVNRQTAIIAMIVANYFSMIAGQGIRWAIQERDRLEWVKIVTIENIVAAHVIAVAVLYVLTVVLEWPFCYWIVRKQPHGFRKSLLASVAVQAVSYTLLILLSIPLSALSPGISIGVAPASQIVDSTVSGWIYYVSPESHRLFRMRMDGSGVESLADIPFDQELDYLCVKPAASGIPQSLDLFARSYRVKEMPVLADFATVARVAPECVASVNDEYITPVSASPFGSSASLVRAEMRTWEVRGGFWGIQGLRAQNLKRGKSVYVGAESFLLNWASFFVTQVSDELVIYQLGAQIVVLDLDTETLGLLAIGRSPLVVLDEPVTSAPSASRP